MKKSIIRVLTFALVLGGVGSMSSCKDYDEDLRVEVGTLANLDVSVNEKLEEQFDELSGQIQGLEEQLRAITSCNCATSKPWNQDLSAAINGALEEISALDQKIDGLSHLTDAEVRTIVTGILTNSLQGYYTQEQVDSLVNAKLAALVTCACDIEALKTEVTTMIQTAITETVTKEFIMDKLTGEYASQAAYDALKAQVDAINYTSCVCVDLTETIRELRDSLTKIRTDVDKNAGDIVLLYQKYNDLNDLYSTLNSKVTTIEQTANAAKTAAENAQTTANDALTKAEQALKEEAFKAFEAKWKPVLEGWETEIPTLSSSVSALETLSAQIQQELSDLKDALNDAHVYEAYDKANVAYGKANTNYRLIVGLRNGYNELKTQVDDFLLSYNTDTTALWNAIRALQTVEIPEAIDTTDIWEAIRALQGAEIPEAIDTTDIWDAIRALQAVEIPEIPEIDTASIWSAIRDLQDITIPEAYDDTELRNKITVLESDSIAALRTLCAINLDAAKTYADAQDAIVTATLQAFVNGRIDSLDAIVKQIDAATNARIDSLNAALDTAFANIDTRFGTIETDITNLKADVDTLKSDFLTIDTRVSDLENWKTTVDTSIGNLETAVQDLTQRVDDIEERLDAIDEKLDDLIQTVDKIKDDIKKMITGVTVNQIHNPVFGTFNLPGGISSHLLLAYYGENIGGELNFPSKDNYIFDNQVLTDAELQMLNDCGLDAAYIEGGKLLSNSNNNAGVVYLTVNPTNVDFTGETLELVNSQGKSAGMVLSPLKKSNKVLDFGYTRAGDNGFYEMAASVQNVSDVQKISFNSNEFKDIFNDIKNYKDGVDVISIAKTAYNHLHSILDANALKATWVDSEGQKHSVLSNYSVAATALKPLSFGFAKDYSGRETLPGYERAEKLIDRLNKEVKSRISSAKDRVMNSLLVSKIENLEIKNIELKNLDKDLVAKFEITIVDTFSLGGKKLTFDIDKDVEIPLTFAKDIDLSGVKFDVPTIVVEGQGEDGAFIWIPVMIDEDGDGQGDKIARDDNGDPIYARLPLGEIKVDGTGSAENVTLPDGTTVPFKFNETVKTHLTLKDLNFEIPDTDDYKFSFDYTVDLSDEIEELWGVVKDQIGGVNDMLGDVKSLVKEVNDLLGRAEDYEKSLLSYVDDITEKVKEYLDKVNNYGIKLVDKAIASLQPCLIVTGNGGTHIGRNTVQQPMQVQGNRIDLIATTYNYEMLTPAYKKHVACVNVWKNGKYAQEGNAEMKNELKRVNKQTNMNKVVNGSLRRFQLDLKSGYTYQFAYSAIDYSGKVCTKRAVIRVK